ncbi:MAG: Gfo/Idh/MocA family oxidoreductase [Planctomycetes bacterium]|nr:Gfo/Idh/MocA family oxidoreductase [Planctomycetota bacterium]
MNRRHFIKASVAAGLATAIPHSRVQGANGDIRVAVVGIRSQGRNHINWFRKIPGVRVVAICDADRSFLEREEQEFAKRSEKVATYVDYRQLLEDKNIDAVITATPNHWHALVTVWACQAGKDVYVEKPVCHNIWEGGQMVAAARKYNRIVQGGMQRRSDTGLYEALDYIKQGNLGKVRLIRGFVYGLRASLGKVEGPQPVPQSVDYNLWCGPAPLAPLTRKELHYDWHWVWPTGDGDYGNNGIHYMDVCRWFAGQDGLAPRVLSVGGRLGYVDDGETPNTQIVFYDYQPVPILFELRNLPRAKGDSEVDHYRGVRYGVIVDCENGYFAGGWAYDKAGKRLKQFRLTEGQGHHQNFIDAVRSRKVSDLHAEVREGYLSSALCHMGNISHRLGKTAAREEIVASFGGNADLAESFERFQDHLLLNGVDLKQTPRTLGPWLTMDPRTTRFTGALADEANRLLRGSYRAPFVVPEQV